MSCKDKVCIIMCNRVTPYGMFIEEAIENEFVANPNMSTCVQQHACLQSLYVYIHIQRTYVCTYACTYMQSPHIYTYTYVHTFNVHVCIVYVYTYMQSPHIIHVYMIHSIYVHKYMYIHAKSTHTYVCMYIHANSTHTYIHVHTYSTCVTMYTYMYIHAN